MNYWRGIWTDGPILEIILQSLCPFSWGVIASCSREAKEYIDIERLQTHTLVIGASGRANGFAGLLLFKGLRHIILDRSTTLIHQDRPAEFDAHWFWLLIENNIDSLIKLEMWAQLAENPGHECIEGVQTFNSYVHQLFRCTQLRELSIEMPPPSGFGTGQLLRRLFSPLRKLGIHSSGWFIDDWHNAAFSSSLADGSVFLTNLVELNLSWESPSTNEDEPSEGEHPHPFMKLMQFATLAKLRTLVFVGYVWSKLMLRTCVAFLNRHAATLTKLQIALNNGGKMRGAKEMLDGLQVMHNISHLMLPPPWCIEEDSVIGFRTFFYECASVHLELDTVARVFPAVECIALIFEPCFFPHIIHRPFLEQCRAKCLKLFDCCSHLDMILEIPLQQCNRDDKLPFSASPSHLNWTSSLVQASQRHGPTGNCWGWSRKLWLWEALGPLLLHHPELRLVRPNCLGL